MSNFEEYKPIEPEYNIRVAVENLKKAYWSDEPEKVAKNFTDAENIIISAICHHGYTVCKERPQGEWIKNEGRDLRDCFYTCSRCGRSINVICGETLADYPFCHCGAKMKGGAE